MNPMGLPPALNLATFTSDSMPPSAGAPTDVPPPPNRAPPAKKRYGCPAIEMSGKPRPVPYPGTGALLVPAT